nr:hypothetical protein [Tanacetum cinerariifolium]
MTTLADKAILSGADNRPPILEKDMYDSWKSRMELYMMNRQHGRMIFESVENGSLLCPTIKENGKTRPKKYSELSATKVIQADCDVKATNIILQGLPPEVYALVSNHKVAKELWERIQLLMQGTSLTKQERELFHKGDDPIDVINHMMSFLTAVVNSRTIVCYNDKGEGHMSKQCTKPKRKKDESWFKDKVLLVQAQANGQILHEEELAFLADPWIAEAQTTQNIALMANLSHYGSDDLAEVHNHDNVTNQVVQAMPLSGQSNIMNKSEIEITSDSNIIPYSQYVSESQHTAVQNLNFPTQQDELILSVIAQLKTQVVNCTKINMENKNVNETLNAELERYKDQVRILKEGNNIDKVSDSCVQSVEIDNLKQTLSEHLKENESLKQTVTILKNDFQKEESRNIDRELALEKKIKELNNIVFKRNQSTQTVHMLMKPHVIQKTNAIVIRDSEETLMLAEESRFKMLLKQKDPLMSEKKVNTKANSMNSDEPNLSTRPTQVEVPKELPKVSTVNTSLKKLKHHLASFDVVVKERTTATAITEGTWGFKHIKACFRDEIIAFLKALKDLFNSFDQFLIDELSEVQNVFYQIEQAVEQHRVESKGFQGKTNKVLNDNERLLEQAISKDVVNIVVTATMNNAYEPMHECERCVKLETELQEDFIKRESYDKLFKQYTTLEKYCISLRIETQLEHEIFQRDNLFSQQRVTLPTSASGSQPSGNIKKDKIQQTPSSSKKNKLEAYPRNVRTSLQNKKSVVNTKNIASVQESKLNVNSDLQCVTLGNVCPLTRITTTAKVPLRKPIPLESNTPKPVVTLVYSRKPKESRNKVPVNKSNIDKSLSADKKEPNKSWGSIVSNVPSSSTIECRLSKLFSGIWTPAAPNT